MRKQTQPCVEWKHLKDGTIAKPKAFNLPGFNNISERASPNFMNLIKTAAGDESNFKDDGDLPKIEEPKPTYEISSGPMLPSPHALGPE